MLITVTYSEGSFGQPGNRPKVFESVQMKNALDALSIDMVSVLIDIISRSRASHWQVLERGLKEDLDVLRREIQQLDAALAGRSR